MKRQWTDESRDAWIRRRTESRTKEQRNDPPRPREDSLTRERDNTRKALISLAKSRAWELQKYPLASCPTPFSGLLLLPLGYMQEEEKKVKVKEGDDLNYVVHQFYNSPPDPDYQGTNFVSSDGIASKRHEFLGPAPLVAGYRFDDTTRTIRIEWWDPYVQLMWIGRGTWKITVYFDEVVGGYVSRPRGDFDQSDDLVNYYGLTKTSDQ